MFLFFVFTKNYLFHWDPMKKINISQHYSINVITFSWCRWSRSLPLLSPSHPASETRKHDVNTAEATNERVNDSSGYLQLLQLRVTDSLTDQLSDAVAFLHCRQSPGFVWVFSNKCLWMFRYLYWKMRHTNKKKKRGLFYSACNVSRLSSLISELFRS